MTDVPTLISRARLEMGDLATPFTSQYQGDSVTKVVTVPRKPVASSGLSAVVVDNSTGIPTTLNQGTDYTVDERSGTLTLATAILSGKTLQVTGTAYRYFTDADWTTFLSTAITDHLHNRQDVQDITFLPVEEEYPVAILGVVMALYALLNDAAFDIDIATPEGVSIPRHQRYEQIQGMLAARLDQYNKWCSAFNVGPWSIEMFSLRRVSRTTGRLVPIYTPQELVDSRWPMEQFPRIDPNGPRLTPGLTLQQVINLVAYSNQAFSHQVTALGDLTGLTVKASVRRYPQALTPLAYMKVVVNDYANGVVTVSLDGSMTYYIGVSKFWDLETVDAQGNVKTLVGGTFDAIRQGSYL